MKESAVKLKCVVVGDEGVGKTSLIITHAAHTFPGEFTPTVFDNFTTKLVVEGEPVQLSLWDTNGSIACDKTRPYSYSEADVFIICYSIDSKKSFESVRNKWVPELHVHAYGVPFILVGTKLELREENEYVEHISSFVSKSEGETSAEYMRAAGHFEVSALSSVNVKEIFTEASKVGMAMLRQRQEAKQRGIMSETDHLEAEDRRLENMGEMFQKMLGGLEHVVQGADLIDINGENLTSADLAEIGAQLGGSVDAIKEVLTEYNDNLQAQQEGHQAHN